MLSACAVQKAKQENRVISPINLLRQPFSARRRMTVQSRALLAGQSAARSARRSPAVTKECARYAYLARVMVLLRRAVFLLQAVKGSCGVADIPAFTDPLHRAADFRAEGEEKRQCEEDGRSDQNSSPVIGQKIGREEKSEDEADGTDLTGPDFFFQPVFDLVSVPVVNDDDEDGN